MTNPTRARRLVAALLATEGCLPEEADSRVAKARELAGRAGIRHEYPALATPEDHALHASSYHSRRARGLRMAPPPPEPTQRDRDTELVRIMIEIMARLIDERRTAQRRHRRAMREMG